MSFATIRQNFPIGSTVRILPGGGRGRIWHSLKVGSTGTVIGYSASSGSPQVRGTGTGGYPNEQYVSVEELVLEGESSPAVVAYKARVVEVARRYARQHSLCDVVEEALREMGALPPTRIVTLTRTVTVEVPADRVLGEDVLAFRGTPPVGRFGEGTRIIENGNWTIKD